MIRHESPSHYLDERSSLGPMSRTFKCREVADIFFPKVTSMFIIQVIEESREALAIKFISRNRLSTRTTLNDVDVRINTEWLNSHPIIIEQLRLTHKSDLWVSQKDNGLLAFENIYISLILVGVAHDAVAVERICGFGSVGPAREVA